MSNILFIWPPKIEYIFSIQKHYTNFGETIAYLEENGCNVDVMDGSALLHFQWDFIQAYSKKYEYLIVYTDLHNAMSAIKAAQLCKKISPTTIIISYGQGASYVPETLIENGFDAVVIDPMYQKTIMDYIKYIEDNNYRTELRGIYFKEGGKLTKIEKRNVLDVSKVAFPALSKIPVKQYKQISGRDQVCFTVARGCPYPCHFCRVPMDQGKKVSYRPIPDIVDYVKEVKDNFKSIKFIAPTFTVDREWVLNLCESILSSGVQSKWIVTTRLELLDKELLDMMSRAGCIAIAFGLETLYSETQKSIDKNLPVDFVTSQVNLLHSSGIIPKAFIMLGIPGQTAKEIEDTYMYLRNNNIEVRPKEYYPYDELLSTDDQLGLLRRFEREDVYNTPIPEVSPSRFVDWLSDRTTVR